MGYEFTSVLISATLSRQNSDKDKRHDALWRDFIGVIQHIANNPKYKEINLTVPSVEEEV